MDSKKLEFVRRGWTIPSNGAEKIEEAYDYMGALEAQPNYGPVRSMYDLGGETSAVQDYDCEQSTSDESDEIDPKKKKGENAFNKEYDGETFPIDGYQSMSISTRPPSLPGNVWKQFFMEKVHLQQVEDIITDTTRQQTGSQVDNPNNPNKPDMSQLTCKRLLNNPN